MLRAVPGDRFDTQRLARLVGVDGHVLGAVVLEDTGDLLGSTDRPDVPNEQNQSNYAFGDVEDDPGLGRHRTCSQGREQDEHACKEHEGQGHGPTDLGTGERLFLLVGGFLCRPRQGSEAQAQRLHQDKDPSDEGDFRPFVPL